MFWIQLLIVGLVAYYVLKRNVVPLTQVPLRLLWLVMMAPTLFWAYRKVAHAQQPIPSGTIIGLFIVCLVFSFWSIFQYPRRRPDRDLGKPTDAVAIDSEYEGDAGEASSAPQNGQ
jgi:hypothetical protein